MNDVKQIVSEWSFPERLDLQYTGIKNEYSIIPKNVTELDVSGSELYINYLPQTIKKLIYHDYSYTELNISLPNLEYLDVSSSYIKNITGLPKKLKTLILNKSVFLEDVLYLPPSLEKLVINGAVYLKSISSEGNIKELTLSECNLLKLPPLPRSLKILDCSHNSIDELPILPISLKKLKCSSNKLKSLPPLHDGLEKVKCSNNKITDLPDLPISIKSLNVSYNNIGVILALPSGLEKLHCVSCDLMTLPELPKTLIKLHCGNNKIIILPNLPTSLTHLKINDNPISDVEYFPRKLKYLNISNCKFRELPEVPAGLKYLYCDNIPLKNEDRLPLHLLELSINRTGIDTLPKLSDKLEYLACNNNFLTKLASLPNTLQVLDCSHNRISKLVKLPASLESLNCSYNKITEVKSLNNIMVLNINHNLLTSLPSADDILILDASYNNISSLTSIPPLVENLDISFNSITLQSELNRIPRSVKYLNVEGNPVYKNIKPEIRTPYFKYETRTFGNEKVNITTIPKGTVLFKGYPSASKINSDFTGWYKKDEKYSYIWPNFNVFFYPYPFVVDDINLGYTDMAMVTYVLQNDIKIILGVLPSNNVRNDRHKSNYLKSCNTINVSANFKGLDYDPCFNPEFMYKNEDVIGSIFLSGTDTADHKKISGENIKLLKYRHFFQDKYNHIGVPEIVLYPFKKRVFSEIRFERSENTLDNVLQNDIDKYNYRPISINMHIARENSEFKTYIDKLLSPTGADGMHMTIDTLTNFFVIYELVDEVVKKRCIPIDENNKLKFLK